MSIDLPVEQFMQRDLLECAPSLSVREAAARMHAAQCGSIVVVDAGQPVGIWTEADAIAGAWRSAGDLERPVADFMSAPVQSIAAQTTLGEAARRFRLAGVRHFLVNDSPSCPLGIVSQTDVVSHQSAGFFLPSREVASLISGVPVGVAAATSFADVRQLMRERGVDAVVVRADQGLGIITQRDVVGALGAGRIAACAGELASFPLLTIPRDGTLFQARRLFSRNRIRHLGVLDDQQALTGLLSFRDVFDKIEHEYVNSLLPELESRTEQLLQTQRQLGRQASLTEAILNALPIKVFVKDEQGRLLIANEMTAQAIGRPLAEIIGKTDAQLFAPELAEPMSNDEKQVRATRQTLVREELQPDGRTFLAQQRMVEVDGAALLIGAAMDVSQWKRADALLVSEHHVLELIAGGSELPVVLDALCQRVENHLPGAWCSILLLAEDGAHLQHGAAPSLPVSFTQAIDGAGGGPAPNPGSAFFGDQAIVEEIASSPRWALYADLASQ